MKVRPLLRGHCPYRQCCLFPWQICEGQKRVSNINLFPLMLGKSPLQHVLWFNHPLWDNAVQSRPIAVSNQLEMNTSIRGSVCRLWCFPVPPSWDTETRWCWPWLQCCLGLLRKETRQCISSMEWDTSLFARSHCNGGYERWTSRRKVRVHSEKCTIVPRKMQCSIEGLCCGGHPWPYHWRASRAVYNVQINRLQICGSRWHGSVFNKTRTGTGHNCRNQRRWKSDYRQGHILARCRDDGIKLHVFGLNSPEWVRWWYRLGINSFDGSKLSTEGAANGWYYVANDGKELVERWIRLQPVFEILSTNCCQKNGRTWLEVENRRQSAQTSCTVDRERSGYIMQLSSVWVPQIIEMHKRTLLA